KNQSGAATCSNDYDRASRSRRAMRSITSSRQFRVRSSGPGARCAHCGCMVLGHGVQAASGPLLLYALRLCVGVEDVKDQTHSLNPADLKSRTPMFTLRAMIGATGNHSVAQKDQNGAEDRGDESRRLVGLIEPHRVPKET